MQFAEHIRLHRLHGVAHCAYQTGQGDGSRAPQGERRAVWAVWGICSASWVSTGANQSIKPQAMDDVVGTEELSRLSRQLGVGNEEVASGMAQILPEVVNHLTPQGEVPADADDIWNSGISSLEQLLKQAKSR